MVHTIMKVTSVFILLVAFSCNQPSSTNSDQDFSLVYENGIDRIDLGANTVTRKYIDSVRTIKFNSTPANRKKILDFIADQKIMSFDSLKNRSDCDMYVLPITSFKLEITIDKGETKTFNWDSNACGDETDILNQLSLLIMEQTVDQLTPEQLPQTNIVVE